MENKYDFSQIISAQKRLNRALSYDSDCELIHVCAELGGTYDLCYKGATFMAERCSPAQKQAIRQAHEQRKLDREIQDREEKRLLREEKIQALRDKKAVRRSWLQLLIAAILGGVVTKIIDFFPVFINWIIALSK